MKILIAVSVYIIGVIVTTLICYKLDIDDDDAVAIAWFWPFCLILTIIFGALWLPVGIYKLLDGKPDKEKDEKVKEYADWCPARKFEHDSGATYPICDKTGEICDGCKTQFEGRRFEQEFHFDK